MFDCSLFVDVCCWLSIVLRGVCQVFVVWLFVLCRFLFFFVFFVFLRAALRVGCCLLFCVGCLLRCRCARLVVRRPCLLVVCCLLVIVRRLLYSLCCWFSVLSLRAHCCVLYVVCCLLIIAGCFLLCGVGCCCWLLAVVVCALRVLRCSLFGVVRLLWFVGCFGVCKMVYVVCRMLFVAVLCCLFSAGCVLVLG